MGRDGSYVEQVPRDSNDTDHRCSRCGTCMWVDVPLRGNRHLYHMCRGRDRDTFAAGMPYSMDSRNYVRIPVDTTGTDRQSNRADTGKRQCHCVHGKRRLIHKDLVHMVWSVHWLFSLYSGTTLRATERGWKKREFCNNFNNCSLVLRV